MLGGGSGVARLVSRLARMRGPVTRVPAQSPVCRQSTAAAGPPRTGAYAAAESRGCVARDRRLCAWPPSRPSRTADPGRAGPAGQLTRAEPATSDWALETAADSDCFFASRMPESRPVGSRPARSRPSRGRREEGSRAGLRQAACPFRVRPFSTFPSQILFTVTAPGPPFAAPPACVGPPPVGPPVLSDGYLFSATAAPKYVRRLGRLGRSWERRLANC